MGTAHVRVEPHLQGADPVGQQQVAAGDEGARRQRIGATAARRPVIALVRIDEREMHRRLREQVAGDVPGGQPVPVVVGLVAQRQHADQVLQPERVALLLVGLAAREADAHVGLEPGPRDRAAAEHAAGDRRQVHEVLAQVEDVVGPARVGRVAIAGQFGEHRHLAVLGPEVGPPRRVRHRHVGVAAVVQQIDQVFHQARIGARRRFAVEDHEVRLDQDAQRRGLALAAAAQALQPSPEAALVERAHEQLTAPGGRIVDDGDDDGAAVGGPHGAFPMG